MSVLCPTESFHGYLEAFRDLRSLAGESWPLMKHIISDFHHAPKLAYETLEGRPIMVWTGCQGGNSIDFLNFRHLLLGVFMAA